MALRRFKMKISTIGFRVVSPIGIRVLLLAMLLFGTLPTTTVLAEQPNKVQSLDDLHHLSDQIVSIAENCVQATVAVISANAAGAGSGVIVNDKGLILTAAHVVAATGDDVFIVFNDGSRRKGKCLGADFDRDAAMIQMEVKPGETVPYVDVADSDLTTKNAWCVSIGHPGGFDPTRTAPLRLGRILSVDRFVNTDCAIVGGDSGGPLFDTKGRVIGIHSNIGASLSQNRHVPVSAFHDYWDEMKDGQRRGRRFAANGGVDPNRPILGTQLADDRGDGNGVTIVGIFEGSAAEKAGLRVGDAIISINDVVVKSRDELIDVVGRFKAGDNIKVTFDRKNDKQTIEVTLGKLSDLARPQEQSPRRPPLDDEKPERSEPEADSKDDCVDDVAGMVFVLNQAPEPEIDGSDAALDKFLDDVLNGGKSKIDSEAVKRFGSMQRILGRLKERVRDRIAVPRERSTQRRTSRNQTVDDEFFQSCLDALEPVTTRADDATVEILVDGEPVSLGTVVSADGIVVTKDTETKSGAISVRFGKDIVDAKLIARSADRDLAVFKVDRNGLVPIEWAVAEQPTRLGSLLTAVDKDGEPLGVGLVSVLPRTLSKVGYLGIATGFVDGGGVLVGDVVNGSAAENAGLKSRDVIKRLNGKLVDSPVEFSYLIQKFRAGDDVEISYRRDGQEVAVKVTLGARSVGGGGSVRARRMNEMSGPLSDRDGGFPEALQHDIPLLPSDCGGPLLDLNGRCIGINVSRAGRVKTFAIPSSDIQTMLSELDSE